MYCAKILIFFLCLLSASKSFGQQSDKIQQAINSIKETYHNEEDDYITDGQRTVWVKSYKKWVPGDFIVMKKEASPILAFLDRAVQHSRYDVLEQLLPNYYRTHGGAKAFAKDIIQANQVTSANGN